MFVNVVLTEDLREDWTCPTEPPLKIKSLLLLLLLYSFWCLFDEMRIDLTQKKIKYPLYLCYILDPI